MTWINPFHKSWSFFLNCASLLHVIMLQSLNCWQDIVASLTRCWNSLYLLHQQPNDLLTHWETVGRRLFGLHNIDFSLCLTWLIYKSILPQQNNTETSVKPHKTAHGAEKFPSSNWAWGKRVHSRGIFRSDVHLGFQWKLYAAVLLSLQLCEKDELPHGIHSKCLPGLCSETSTCWCACFSLWICTCKKVHSNSCFYLSKKFEFLLTFCVLFCYVVIWNSHRNVAGNSCECVICILSYAMRIRPLLPEGMVDVRTATRAPF